LIAGRVYVVHTTLTNPPKDKICLCVCDQENLFVWINTEARKHGVGQFPLAAVDHPAFTHACHLDLSRLTTFQERELKAAGERAPISADLAKRIVEFAKANPPKTLPKKHLDLILALVP
jgi:hypothetical protein